MPTISEIRRQFPMYADVPDEQLVIGLHRKFYSDMPFAEFHRNIQYDKGPDPTQDMGFTDKFNTGMGKAFADIGRGAAQMVGMGPTGEEVKEQRRLDAPLMNTGAGTAGNISGNIAALAPAALIPGAGSVAGAGAIGATIAALQPTESTGERLVNMGVGGGLAAGTQALAGPVAQRLGERAGEREAAAAAKQSQNAVRDATLRAGHEAGYVVPPSAVNEPSFIGGRMEGLAGKAALGQESSIRNQGVTDTLARRAATLAPDEALSEGALQQARQRASEPYRQIAGMNRLAATELEAWQNANNEAKLAWNEFKRQGTRQAFHDAKTAEMQAATALNNIENIAQQSGRTDLVPALKAARVQIAKIHDVEKSLNVGTGSVDASELGRLRDKGVPLTGELKTIADFQQAFPLFMREGSKVPAPGVGKTELLAAALLGGGGFVSSDSGYGALAGLAPFASGPARSLLLSRAVQGHVANPNYAPGALTRGTAALQNPETRRRLGVAARALAFPSIHAATSER